MHDAVINLPPAHNEKVLTYAPGSPERVALKAALNRMASQQPEIPCIIGGERVETGRLSPVVMPHHHDHVLARFHAAGRNEVQRAIAAAADAKREWAAMRWESRAAIFLRAAELLSTKYRMILNAATMLGQSKTCHQAEIDSACELIDFWRYNCSYSRELYAQQPTSAPGIWNSLEFRPLEGFVLAITPFNFTAIAGNLPTSPALMGNTVLWKPADTQTLAAYYTYLLLEEAGLPPGVINFLPGDGAEISAPAIDHAHFAGLHFTGSTAVFRSLWQNISNSLSGYRSYPRLVGETGGKDFIVAHPSADHETLVTAIVRGGFEYQGQKCSAASRVYVARSVWERMRDPLIAHVEGLRAGDIRDFRNFMGAVIKKESFTKHKAVLKEAKAANGVSILTGGQVDDRVGWFVQPTVLICDDPGYRTMKEELFGPIVSMHIYPDERYEDILETVDQTSPYALTGAIFAKDRNAINLASDKLRYSAGNFYINDKPTGAVVGQQPFGGARASGTNDKAGAAYNLIRWVEARTIKENFSPPTNYRYVFMDDE